jgi:hypothetical protein
MAFKGSVPSGPATLRGALPRIPAQTGLLHVSKGDLGPAQIRLFENQGILANLPDHPEMVAPALDLGPGRDPGRFLSGRSMPGDDTSRT